jgi:hypothetical protein
MRYPIGLAMVAVMSCTAWAQGQDEATREAIKELEKLEAELPPDLPEVPPDVPDLPPEPPGPTFRELPEPPPPPEPVIRRPAREEEGPSESKRPDLLEDGAASGKFGGELTGRWQSEYYFRGLKFSRNDVLQGEAALWYKGFKLKGFLNYDFGPNEVNEADGSISFNFPVSEDTVVEAGYTYYGYPHRVIEDTQEFFAGIRQEWVVNSSVYAFYDFDEGSGALWEFTVGKNLPIGNFDPFLRGTAVLNARYFNDDTEFSHGTFTAGLPFYLCYHTILFADINYQWGWQGWVKDDWFATAGMTVHF